MSISTIYAKIVVYLLKTSKGITGLQAYPIPRFIESPLSKAGIVANITPKR